MTEPQMSAAMKPLIQPTTPQQHQASKADNVLTAKIMHALEADHQLGRREVDHMSVAVSGGVATLTGHVGRAINKTRAAAVVSETPRVAAIVNDLVLDYDLMIDAARVLGHDPQTKDEQIQVNVQHGVVYLGGTVTRAAVRVAATQAAARIPQARGIINVIKVPGIALDADEERFVQPQIGKGVYATDGQVGRVHRVVISPQSRRVTTVVVHAQIALGQEADGPSWSTERSLQPLSQRYILIPITSIECAQSGGLLLNVKSSKAARFGDFDQRNFVLPPAEWLPPYPYVSADVLFCQGS